MLSSLIIFSIVCIIALLVLTEDHFRNRGKPRTRIRVVAHTAPLSGERYYPEYHNGFWWSSIYMPGELPWHSARIQAEVEIDDFLYRRQMKYPKRSHTTYIRYPTDTKDE